VSLLSGAAVLSAAGSKAHLDVQLPGAELKLDHSSCSTDASMKREHANQEVAPAPCSVVIGVVRFQLRQSAVLINFSLCSSIVCKGLVSVAGSGKS
jgi:hypothetical protein